MLKIELGKTNFKLYFCALCFYVYIKMVKLQLKGGPIGSPFFIKYYKKMFNNIFLYGIFSLFLYHNKLFTDAPTETNRQLLL